MIFIIAKHNVLGDLILIYKIDNELSLDTMSLTEVRLSSYSGAPLSTGNTFPAPQGECLKLQIVLSPKHTMSFPIHAYL